MDARGQVGTVSFDGTFVTIHRKGFRALINGATGEKRLPIANVTGVHWKEPSGFSDGYIQFTIPGGVEARGIGAGTAWSDENSMTFTRAQQPAFEALRAAIEQTIAARTSQGVTPGLPATTAADEILKFAQLRDKGIISDAEFEAKKAELLGL